MGSQDLADVIARGGLQIDRDGAAMTVWLSRPDSRNSQTPHTWQALAQVAASIPADVDIVFIRGRGPAFSSGLDRAMFSEGLPGVPSLASMSAMATDEFSQVVDTYQQAFCAWRSAAPVVVAVVHGYAIGAGFQLALGADFIVATQDAWFSMREVQLGLVPDLAGTLPLVDAVGYATALDICATGRNVSAEEANRLGFVSRTCAEEELDATVAEIAAAVTGAPGRAAVDVKRVLRGSAHRNLDAQREHERRIQHERVVLLSNMLGAQ